MATVSLTASTVWSRFNNYLDPLYQSGSVHSSTDQTPSLTDATTVSDASPDSFLPGAIFAELERRHPRHPGSAVKDATGDATPVGGSLVRGLLNPESTPDVMKKLALEDRKLDGPEEDAKLVHQLTVSVVHDTRLSD